MNQRDWQFGQGGHGGPLSAVPRNPAPHCRHSFHGHPPGNLRDMPQLPFVIYAGTRMAGHPRQQVSVADLPAAPEARAMLVPVTFWPRI